MSQSPRDGRCRTAVRACLLVLASGCWSGAPPTPAPTTRVSDEIEPCRGILQLAPPKSPGRFEIAEMENDEVDIDTEPLMTFEMKPRDAPCPQCTTSIGRPPFRKVAITETDRELYVQVRDIRAALASVVDLGGAALSEPFDVPNGPTIAFAQDPEENPLVLVQQ